MPRCWFQSAVALTMGLDQAMRGDLHVAALPDFGRHQVLVTGRGAFADQISRHLPQRPAPFCERPAFVGRLPLIRVGTGFVQARSVVSVAVALSTVVFTLVIAIMLIDIQYRPVV